MSSLPRAPIPDYLCAECSREHFGALCSAASAAARAEELLEEQRSLRPRELQLRLPMSPLPHVAHHPGRVQRAAFLPFQPELI